MYNTSCSMRLMLFIFVSYYVIIIALVCYILLRLLVITANWRAEVSSLGIPPHFQKSSSRFTKATVVKTTERGLTWPDLPD